MNKRKHKNEESKPDPPMKKPTEPKKDSLRNREIESNRRYGQATRTLRACDLCRRQKTRCFKSSNDAVSCLRCSFLNKRCSFESNVDQNVNPIAKTTQADSGELKERIDEIHKNVNEILLLLKSNPEIHDFEAARSIINAASLKRGVSPGASSFMMEVGHQKLLIESSNNDSTDFEKAEDDAKVFRSPAVSFEVSPFSLIYSQFDGHRIPRPIFHLLSASSLFSGIEETFGPTPDIFALGILNVPEAVNLMNVFRRNYGRWVLFPQNITSQALVEKMKLKSPLLLTTCCCISMRYMLSATDDSKNEDNQYVCLMFKRLMRQLLHELDRSILKNSAFQNTITDGDIEFLQALVILSIYSLLLSSLSTSDIMDDIGGEINLQSLNLDPWYLSSLGLNTFITKSTFGLLLPKAERKSDSPMSVLYNDFNSTEHQKLTVLRIYNHLTLVHLINCIFSGRMCVIDEIRLNYCTSTLSLTSATNFDGRMVSEIGILLIVYNYIQVALNSDVVTSVSECETNYSTVKEEISSWYDQWEYLFNQPALQFVEFNYHFCYLIATYTFNFQKCCLSADNLDYSSDSPYEIKKISGIIGKSDEDSFSIMLNHSFNLVAFVNAVKDDSYFAYLSDQIHFSAYFGAVVLIHCIKLLRDNRNLDFLPTKLGGVDVSQILGAVNYLIKRLDKIGQFKDDIVQKYSSCLHSLLHELGFI